MNGFSFNPTQYAPQYGLPTIQPGKYPAVVSKAEPTRSNNNQANTYLKIEFTLTQQAGQYAGRKVYKNINLWNQSQQASEIAHGEMSALLLCMGIAQEIQQLDVMYNRPLLIEVVENGQYSEVKTFYDINGNQPGKANQPMQQMPQQQGNFQPQQTQQPMQPQPQGGNPFAGGPQQGGGYMQQPTPQQPQQGFPQQGFNPGAPQQSMPQPGAPTGPNTFQQPPAGGGNPFAQQGQYQQPQQGGGYNPGQGFNPGQGQGQPTGFPS